MKHIYVMQRADDAIKIGVAYIVEKRRKTLQYKVKQAIIVLHVTPSTSGAFEAEHLIYRDIGKFAIGEEWYKCEPNIAIEAVEKAYQCVLRAERRKASTLKVVA